MGHDGLVGFGLVGRSVGNLDRWADGVLLIFDIREIGNFFFLALNVENI